MHRCKGWAPTGMRQDGLSYLSSAGKLVAVTRSPAIRERLSLPAQWQISEGESAMTKQRLMVALKRVYEEPEPSDGTRVLVERLWPRGPRDTQREISKRAEK